MARSSRGFWGTGEQRHLFQGNKETKVWSWGEQMQFKGTGNIKHQYIDFGEWGEQSDLFQKNKGTDTPWEGLMVVYTDIHSVGCIGNTGVTPYMKVVRCLDRWECISRVDLRRGYIWARRLERNWTFYGCKRVTISGKGLCPKFFTKSIYLVTNVFQLGKVTSFHLANTMLSNRPGVLWLERKFRIGWSEIWREEKNKPIGIILFQIYLTSATSSDDLCVFCI